LVLSCGPASNPQSFRGKKNSSHGKPYVIEALENKGECEMFTPRAKIPKGAKCGGTYYNPSTQEGGSRKITSSNPTWAT
jgi:hypothetical protein